MPYSSNDARHPNFRVQRIATLDSIAQSSSDPEARAMAVAAFSHAGQFRKYTGEPYFSHVMDVRNVICSMQGNTQRQRVAALLHDIVEDGKLTGVVIEDITRWFDRQTAEDVAWLTDVSLPENGNREARRAIDREHTSRAPGEIQSVKYADIISNTKTILKQDKNFAAIYLPEKLAQLKVATEGNMQLWTQAHDIIITSLKSLSCQQSDHSRYRL